MMTQFDAPMGSVRRTGGGINVYTGLLCVAFLVLVAGVALLMKRNTEHSGQDDRSGGPFQLVERR
ncbi:MAG: hypothetical protein ACYSXF_03505 [Planctomycetota bacterium]|jgi:hypothetical protein